MATRLFELVLRRDGREIERVRALIDSDDGKQLHRHLLAALGRNRGSIRDIAKYAVDVHRPGRREPEFTFTGLYEKGGR